MHSDYIGPSLRWGKAGISGTAVGKRKHQEHGQEPIMPRSDVVQNLEVLTWHILKGKHLYMLILAMPGFWELLFPQSSYMMMLIWHSYDDTDPHDIVDLILISYDDSGHHMMMMTMMDPSRQMVGKQMGRASVIAA